MRKIIVTLSLTAAAASSFVLGSSSSATSPSSPAGPVSHAPAPDTIVDVDGDAANGFGIEYYDGSSLFPPTDSEARAECSEYDTRVARVRCRTKVRVWYRDLADLQQALDWAHAQA